MSRLRWPDSTNSVSDVPGTIQARSGRHLVFKRWQGGAVGCDPDVTRQAFGPQESRRKLLM